MQGTLYQEGFMLGAIIILLLIAAAAYAVTQIGGVITLLFIAAILFLAILSGIPGNPYRPFRA